MAAWIGLPGGSAELPAAATMFATIRLMSELRRIGHYLLEERLGSGGMGEVYRARDLALGRSAALKLVVPGADDVVRQRLLDEVQHSARLQHPAIATFFDGGLDGDVAWLAMEYVPGETLRSRLSRGPLAVRDTLALAMGVLEGLTHAHAVGILHRDIKPENLMLRPDGRVKLLDFGIARALTAAGDASTQVNLTGLGVAVGTVGYMAPEQLHGHELDGRADLFSLAAVLYEAIAGRPAFPGATALERITAVLTRDAPPLSPELIPERVASAIMAGLVRDRDQRPASAQAWLRDFRALADGASAPVTVAGPATLAVIDFENLADRAEDAWLGSGIAESLASDLTRVPGLQVIARERVVRARADAGAGSDALGVAQRLGCRWVLAGSFQKLGPRLRINTRLADVGSGCVAFAEKLDGAVEDVFAMQDQLAAAVAAALDLHAAPSAPAKPQLSAWQCFARGREEFLRRDRGSIQRARELFEEAVAIDPLLAEAHAGLAGTHAMSFTFTADADALYRAKEHADRAIAAKPDLAEAYIWRGYAHWRLGRVEAALADERRAAALDPSQERAFYFEGALLLADGRTAEALVRAQRAVELAPASTYAWLLLGLAHLEGGAFDEAEWCFTRARDLEGSSPQSHIVGAGALLGEVHRRRGDPAAGARDALEALERVESADHMYRDTQRVMCLLILARSQIDGRRHDAAAAALQQAVAHLRGRPRTLGGGLFMVQALASLARVTGDAGLLDEAARLQEARTAFDFSWGFCATEADALVELALAGAALGRREQAARWLADARAARASRLREIDGGVA